MSRWEEAKIESNARDVVRMRQDVEDKDRKDTIHSLRSRVRR